ncbi:MAG: hypothetical protein JXX29_18640 [Deltaproteobacteria bacterium]|nr:hypothetical protein [Deltaproteobacteria bacterium]MBN2673704.1 hypothetical protein [Deltaproteobacteria bacterium]
MSIGSITNSYTSSLQSSTSTDNAALGKEDFLKLLISQMQHQDPLEPMKNHEMVAQLATFSNVEQLVAANEGITNLGAITATAYETQANSYIGKDVEVISDKMYVDGSGTTIDTGFYLESNASSVNVSFVNSQGDTVRTMQLGARNAGQVDVSWNSLGDDGSVVSPDVYTMKVSASDVEGHAINYEPRIRETVTGVSYDSGSAVLQLGDLQATVANIVGVYPSNAN